MRGYPTSTAPQGLGGGARVNTGEPSSTHSDLNFFIWLAILGIIIPGIIIGSLKVGGFQFVFKHR